MRPVSIRGNNSIYYRSTEEFNWITSLHCYLSCNNNNDNNDDDGDDDDNNNSNDDDDDDMIIILIMIIIMSVFLEHLSM